MKKAITPENVLKWGEIQNGIVYVICISAILKAFLLASSSLVNNDGLLYLSAAQELTRGHFKEALDVFPMPFYPILISVVHFLIQDWVTAAKMISALFIIFTLIPLYLITMELFDRKASFWASLAFAIAPAANGWADAVIRDPGFMFCVAWSVYFAVRSSQFPRMASFAAAAVFSWISVLFRIEGIILILFFPSYFLILSFYRDGERASLIKGSLAFLSLPLLLAALYYIFGFYGEVSFNRSDYVYEEIQKLLRMEFLDNYRVLSAQLDTLVGSSPSPGFANNFAEIAKHYIPVIYLLGLTETYITVLFPLFILPLIFGLKEPVKKNNLLLPGLFVSYILVAYYFLLKMDFLTSRYLSVPVLLAYPWIGAGMSGFIKYLSEKFSRKIFPVLFLIFITVPAYSSIEQKWKGDNSLIAAAEWIKNNPRAPALRIITSDKRFLFYSGREYWIGDAFSGVNKDGYYNIHDKDSDYGELERIAAEKEYDLVLFRISSKKNPPDFTYYKKIKEFKGKKNVSYVFSSPKAARILGIDFAD